MSMIWLSQFLIPENLSRSLYKELREAVQKRIIPKLEKEEFRQYDHPKWLKPSARDKAYNPHGIFQRSREGRDDMIEIVYDDRKYPQVYLTVGIAPHEGVKVWGKPFRFQDMGVAECPVTYSLSASRRSFKPFAVLWPIMGREDIPNLLESICEELPQILEWFEHENVGPNLFGGPNHAVSGLSNDDLK